MSFERKTFANLPHAPNKAMNLNAFLGLVGGHWRTAPSARGDELVACEPADATCSVPSSPFVAVIDADTVIAPDYLGTMLALLASPEHRRTAIVQTPYSAFPGAPGSLERIAGATTDVQYFVHQGMSRFDAAYWVGANAVLRMDAIRTLKRRENGHTVFLSDRTVIEDTETTLELRRTGWRVASHPERLAFSATPRDFGALSVQRLRWANGGLLMLRHLLRALGAAHARPAEAFLRLHYLVSLGPTNLGMLLLPFCLFGDGVAAQALPLLALVYLALYGLDLRACGYRWSDLPRVYALNLLLIPVHLAGMFASLQQAVSGRKAVFTRTPNAGTAAPGSLLLSETAMFSVWSMLAVDLWLVGRPVHAGLVALHAGLLAYAIAVFIGPKQLRREVTADLLANLRSTDAADIVTARK